MKTSVGIGALAFIAALGLLAPIASADLIDDVEVGDYLRLYDGPGGGNGGEFEAKVMANSTTYTNVVDSWFTFCIERNEHFNYGEQQRVETISDTAIGGGVNASGGGDVLEYTTAYLYTQFRNGTLEGRDGTGNFFDTNEEVDNATALQEAIWWLEGEYGATAAVTDRSTEAQHYISLAQNAGWTSHGNVRVMNLERQVTVSGSTQWIDAQSQLMLVPEPASVALLGIGLAAAACLRRRRVATLSR